MDDSLQSRARELARRIEAEGGEDLLQRIERACGDDDALRAQVEAILLPGTRTETASELLPTAPMQEPDIARAIPADAIPGYVIERLLGRGGFGSVWLATQHRPVQRHVAVKFVHAESASSGLRERFELETQLLAQLNHPNIATLYDAGVTESGRPYFIMEYVEDGLRISEYCRRNELGVQDRIRLFLDVLAAVSYLHDNAVVHRDLSGNNVLVVAAGSGPKPKVIDFGLAKLLDSPEAQGQTQGGVGTPGFASPEQWYRYPITTRSDTYSLGALLHLLLVGRAPEVPKPGTRLASASQALEHEGAADHAKKLGLTLDNLRKLVQGDLDWILRRALEFDPEHRYRTVNEFGEDLDRFLRNETVRARPQSLAYSARKFLQRNRVRVIAASIVIPLLVAAPLIARQVTRFEERQKLRQSSLDGFERGQALHAEARSNYDELFRLRERYRQVFQETESHLPFWKRDRELAVFDSLRTVEATITRTLNDAIVALTGAIEQAPDEESAEPSKLELESLYWYLGDLTKRGLALQEEHEVYERLAGDLGVGSYDDILEGRSTVVFEAPAGTEIHVFRYEDVEARLTPLAFDPRTGRVASPVLVVERVVDPEVPFRPDDEVRAVGGVKVATESDFARALDGLAAGQEVRVGFTRAGRDTVLDWTPKRLTPEGIDFGPELVDLRQQLGFWFRAYPLRFPDWSRLESGAEIEFPKGSYLTYARAPGFAPARIPFVAPGAPDTLRFQMIGESEVPAGFVYVHEGYAEVGGTDQEYRQSLPVERTWVDGFFMSRTEVSVDEYYEFLNSPGIRERIDEEGYMEPRSPGAATILKERSDAGRGSDQAMERFHVVPSRVSQLSDEGTWEFTEPGPRWPVINVTLLGAMEYAYWRSEQSGGKWTFRIPTDVEWEKAARGVDRRTHVWGNYLMWPYCYNPSGHLGTSLPVELGITPYDESIYGVRDMAGSVAEWTLTRTLAGLAFRSQRGGHWNSSDEYRYSIESRVGMFPERTSSSNGLGFRLVAELPSPSAGP